MTVLKRVKINTLVTQFKVCEFVAKQYEGTPTGKVFTQEMKNIEAELRLRTRNK